MAKVEVQMISVVRFMGGLQHLASQNQGLLWTNNHSRLYCTSLEQSEMQSYLVDTEVELMVLLPYTLTVKYGSVRVDA